MFEIQKSGDKKSSGEIGLDIRTHASPFFSFEVGFRFVCGRRMVAIIAYRMISIVTVLIFIWKVPKVFLVAMRQYHNELTGDLVLSLM